MQGWLPDYYTLESSVCVAFQARAWQARVAGSWRCGDSIVTQGWSLRGIPWPGPVNRRMNRPNSIG